MDAGTGLSTLPRHALVSCENDDGNLPQMVPLSIFTTSRVCFVFIFSYEVTSAGIYRIFLTISCNFFIVWLVL